MASLILSSAGNAVFGPVGGFLGALAGRAIDSAAITALTPARVQPSRLAGLNVQTSQEGVPIPIVYGRFRVTGQIIWATKFHEINSKRTIGGKGGQRVVEHSYTISFAIGLCEGPIGGIGKVWVNGEVFDLATVTHRLYLGDETQTPDPLIEAIEGLAQAPAYRGLSYVVFEDFNVTPFGDRIPQFSFEVFAAPASGDDDDLKQLAQAVCLIPGAGEFVYATTPVRKVKEAGDEIGENLHASASRADFEVSLDNLARDFPNVKSVSLVAAWFGTDLRAGQCQIIPKVENATKQTIPLQWSVAGLSRATAQVVSQSNGKPAYGGSPSDQSIIEAIQALKTRGLRVTHNPFIMMDIPTGNALPNPYGGNTQAAYPWRGRITCFPAIGKSASADGTAQASSQIASFFGTASASHFAVVGGKVIYTGPNEWSYRRFVLHQAALTLAAGGVDTFLIGSELIGLTRVRSASGTFPAVNALISLAQEVRTLLGPSVKITYGADWTEYGAYALPGTNDLRFPLDPLWANPVIDFIGLDWYAPLTDRRPSEPQASIVELGQGVETGEGFDFYYSNEAARQAKARTPITDGAYQEPWVWRQKDIRGFWSNQHFERSGGVRAPNPTAWVPKSKPMALMELGFPAVDKGANRPSVFPDPKSSESGLPPFSNGARDDGEQKRALCATLKYWRDHNEPATLYQGEMLDMSRTHLWAWDGRPFPYFPALLDQWADGTYAMLGHWLAGRSGLLNLSALIKDICTRSGLNTVDVSGVSGSVEGFAIETPTIGRNVLDVLFQAFGFEAISQSTGLMITDPPSPIANLALTPDDICVDTGKPDIVNTRQADREPSGGRFSCYAAENDYLPTVFETPLMGGKSEISALAASLVLGLQDRMTIAQRLAGANDGEALTLKVGPELGAYIEVADRFSLGDGAVWRVDQIEGQFCQTIVARRAPNLLRNGQPLNDVISANPIKIAVAPIVEILDLPAPFSSPYSPMPLVGCASANWSGPVEISIDDSALGSVSKPMALGRVLNSVPVGPVGRLIRQPLTIQMKFGSVLPNTGTAALIQNDRIIDIINWRRVRLVAADQWEVSDWVRGLDGSASGMVVDANTRLVVIDDALVAMPIDPSLENLEIEWRGALSVDTSLVSRKKAVFAGNAKRPWSPCHLHVQRTNAGVQFRWIRRARGNGEAWGMPNVPLGATQERYCLQLRSQNGAIKHVAYPTTSEYVYTSNQELIDFGSVQTLFRVCLFQIGDDDREGMPTLVDVAA